MKSRGNLFCTKLKERITSEISPAQFPREPSTVRSASLHKGTNECAPCIPKQFASFYKSINNSAPRTSKRQEHALGRRRGSGAHGGQDSTGRDIGQRTSKSSSPSEELDSRILRGYYEAKRIWQPRPISYQAQGPRRRERNVQGRTKKVQTAKRRCRGQSLKTASTGVPSKND